MHTRLTSAGGGESAAPAWYGRGERERERDRQRERKSERDGITSQYLRAKCMEWLRATYINQTRVSRTGERERERKRETERWFDDAAGNAISRRTLPASISPILFHSTITALKILSLTSYIISEHVLYVYYDISVR